MCEVDTVDTTSGVSYFINRDSAANAYSISSIHSSPFSYRQSRDMEGESPIVHLSNSETLNLNEVESEKSIVCDRTLSGIEFCKNTSQSQDIHSATPQDQIQGRSFTSLAVNIEPSATATYLPYNPTVATTINPSSNPSERNIPLTNWSNRVSPSFCTGFSDVGSKPRSFPLNSPCWHHESNFYPEDCVSASCKSTDHNEDVDMYSSAASFSLLKLTDSTSLPSVKSSCGRSSHFTSQTLRAVTEPEFLPSIRFDAHLDTDLRISLKSDHLDATCPALCNQSIMSTNSYATAYSDIHHRRISEPTLKVEVGVPIAVPRPRKMSTWYHLITPTYRKKLARFRHLFSGTPVDTNCLLVDYLCALAKNNNGLILQGRMYITENWICFYSKILYETRIFLEVKDIVSITKEKTARLIPNAIQIVHSNPDDRYFFISFAARERTFAILRKVWESRQSDRPSAFCPTENITVEELLCQVRDIYAEDSLAVLSVEEADNTIDQREDAATRSDNFSSMSSTVDVTCMPTGCDARSLRRPTDSRHRSSRRHAKGLSHTRKRRRRPYTEVATENFSKDIGQTKWTPEHASFSDGYHTRGSGPYENLKPQPSMVLNSADQQSKLLLMPSLTTSNRSPSRTKTALSSDCAFPLDNHSIRPFATSSSFDLIESDTTDDGPTTFELSRDSCVETDAMQDMDSFAETSPLRPSGATCISQSTAVINDESSLQPSQVNVGDKCHTSLEVCGNKHEHPGRMYIDCPVQLNVDALFDCLLADSRFFAKFCIRRGTFNINQSNWPPKPWKMDTSGNVQNSVMQPAIQRQISYTLSLKQRLGPRTCVAVETQTVLAEDTIVGRRYVVDAKVTNKAVPLCNCFHVLIRYCLLHNGPSTSQLKISAQVVYDTPVFFGAKGIIENTCKSNLIDNFNDLLNFLNSEVASLNPMDRVSGGPLTRAPRKRKVALSGTMRSGTNATAGDKPNLKTDIRTSQPYSQGGNQFETRKSSLHNLAMWPTNSVSTLSQSWLKGNFGALPPQQDKGWLIVIAISLVLCVCLSIVYQNFLRLEKVTDYLKPPSSNLELNRLASILHFTSANMKFAGPVYPYSESTSCNSDMETLRVVLRAISATVSQMQTTLELIGAQIDKIESSACTAHGTNVG